jgi:hypothetical protein
VGNRVPGAPGEREKPASAWRRTPANSRSLPVGFSFPSTGGEAVSGLTLSPILPRLLCRKALRRDGSEKGAIRLYAYSTRSWLRAQVTETWWVCLFLGAKLTPSSSKLTIASSAGSRTTARAAATHPLPLPSMVQSGPVARTKRVQQAHFEYAACGRWTYFTPNVPSAARHFDLPGSTHPQALVGPQRQTHPNLVIASKKTPPFQVGQRRAVTMSATFTHPSCRGVKVSVFLAPSYLYHIWDYLSRVFSVCV